MKRSHEDQGQLPTSWSNKKEKTTEESHHGDLVEKPSIVLSGNESSDSAKKNEAVIESTNEGLEINSNFVKKNKKFFQVYYEYVGHKPKTKNFEATCRACKTTKPSVLTSKLDEHNYKSNAKRHYQSKHKEINYQVDSGSHQLESFISISKGAKYTEKDPFQHRLNLCYLDMVAVDGCSFGITGGMGFRNLLRELNPRVRATSKTSLSRILTKHTNEKLKPNLVKELKLISDECLHLSTDIWTSRRGIGTIGVKAHYLLEGPNKWELVSKVIALQKFNERHTSINIHDKISTVLKKMEIKSKQIGFVLTDGANNMVAALKDVASLGCEDEPEDDETVYSSEEESDDEDSIIDQVINAFDKSEEPVLTGVLQNKRITCYAHSLQLVVNDAMKSNSDVKKIFINIQKITSFFNKSSFWKGKLREATGKELIRPVVTRWNSYFQTLDRLTEENVYKTAVTLILDSKSAVAASKSTKSLNPPDSRHELLELCVFFKHISVATDKLQSDGVTSSSILYEIGSCFDEIAKSEAEYFEEFKAALLSSIKKRFQEKLFQKHVIIPALLDPRLKRDVFEMPVASDCNVHLILPKADAAVEVLKREMKTIVGSLSCEPNARANKGDKFSKLAPAKARNSNNAEELTKYLLIERESEDTDPLEYWRKTAAIFPTLSALAKRYLTFPASTGGIERTFSIVGSFCRPRRSNLTTETMEKLLLHRDARLPYLTKMNPASNLYQNCDNMNDTCDTTANIIEETPECNNNEAVVSID